MIWTAADYVEAEHSLGRRQTWSRRNLPSSSTDHLHHDLKLGKLVLESWIHVHVRRKNLVSQGAKDFDLFINTKTSTSKSNTQRW